MNKYILSVSCALLFSGAWAQEIFHSIVLRQTDGTVQTLPLDKVQSISFSTEASVQQCKWYHSLENPGIADYLRDFDYNPDNYNYHRIFQYRGEPYLDERQDWPYGVTLGDTTYYNLIPGRQYQLQPLHHGQLEPAISIQTLGQLRMLRTEGIDNVRDLGGWPTTDGHRLKYGLLFRGTELNTKLSSTNSALHSAHQITDADRDLLLNELHIGAELDLRGSSEIPSPISALGKEVVYRNINFSFTDIDTPANHQALVDCLRFLITQLEAGRPTYIHCVWGADRTGLLCMLLEGLIGLKQSDIDKEYELTSFTSNSRFRTNNNYLSALQKVTSLPGETLQKKFRSWWLRCGATEAELDTFVSLVSIH